MLATKSKQCTVKGKNINESFVKLLNPASWASVTPIIIADKISAVIDSNKSAHCPAQSPTLSPTKSAITAGFLWSSSGIPASILPKN